MHCAEQCDTSHNATINSINGLDFADRACTTTSHLMDRREILHVSRTKGFVEYLSI
jgi:3-dehydroquinate synthase class II